MPTKQIVVGDVAKQQCDDGKHSMGGQYMDGHDAFVSLWCHLEQKFLQVACITGIASVHLAALPEIMSCFFPMSFCLNLKV